MKNNEIKKARRFDTLERSKEFNRIVYSGDYENRDQAMVDIAKVNASIEKPSSKYNLYFGELHGHSNLSDGRPSIDEYFTNLRDKAKLDFAALSDHDHGGPGNKPLWDGKWDIIKQKVREYNQPGKFTTILSYERDSYPFYSNLVVYYDNYDGDMLIGKQPGEITHEELREYLNRDDIILVPHDTNIMDFSADFFSLELEDMTPLIQVYSRASYTERRDPKFILSSNVEGGHWQDALAKGAKMGCIAASDDHGGNGGIISDNNIFPTKFPGLTGVWAKDNTLPSIFEALKARRCYGFMGGRIALDFRINDHYMGEEIVAAERKIYFNIKADEKISTVTLVKNCRDAVIFKACSEQIFVDYHAENETDFYYVRVELSDGRMAWSSPIWVKKPE